MGIGIFYFQFLGRMVIIFRFKRPALYSSPPLLVRRKMSLPLLVCGDVSLVIKPLGASAAALLANAKLKSPTNGMIILVHSIPQSA
jgi:hypothetical protein